MKKLFFFVLFMFGFFYALVAIESNVGNTKIAVLAGYDGLGDNAFNDSAFSGCINIAKNTNSKLVLNGKIIVDGETAEITFIIPSSTTQYQNEIKKLASNNYKAIICIGSDYVDSVLKGANKYPAINFSIVDASIIDSTKLPNLACFSFKDWESSFLAGYVTGLFLNDNFKDKKIGFIGGMNIDLVNRYQYGFFTGAIYANKRFIAPENRLLDYVSSDSSGFYNTGKISQLADKQYNSNCGVIFQALGDSGMKALFNEAKKNNSFAIGIDGNKAMDAKNVSNGTANSIITSTEKRIDSIVSFIINNQLKNNYKKGNYEVGIAEDALDVIINNENTPLIVKYLDNLNLIKDKIKNGEIVVPQNKVEFNKYLDVLNK